MGVIVDGENVVGVADQGLNMGHGFHVPDAEDLVVGGVVDKVVAEKRSRRCP